MKRLEHNLERFAKNHPQEAIHLAYLDVEKCLIDPKKDQAEAWALFSSLDVEKKEVIFIFGVGLGFFYEAALPWLRKKRGRRICFLENDLKVIYHLFETSLGTKILKDTRVELLYIQDIQKESNRLTQMYWSYALKPYTITSLPRMPKEEASIFEHKIFYEMVKNNIALKELLEGGVSYYRNFYLNMLWLDTAYRGDVFFKAFPKVPAIICGAGPSLTKQLRALSKLKDKALIFAGGSAMNALNSFGILPHFGVGIDPNTGQFERIDQNSAFEVPYFYRNRIFHYALRRIHGPKLYIAGSEAYETSKFFEEKFQLSSEVDIEEGYNVITFAANLASLMGCDPIIFVGMDLGFTDLKFYSEGIVEDSKVSKELFSKVENFEDQPLLKKDIYGRPLYTLWKWIYESDWFSEFAASHPEIKVFNATEGGLGFPGVENIALKDFSGKTLDLEEKIFATIEKGKIEGVSFESLKNLTKELQESLKRSVGLLEGLLEEIDKMEKRLKEEKKPLDSLETGRSAFLGSELEEEVAFEAILKLFLMFIQRFLSRDLKQIKSLLLWKKQLKQLDLSRKQFQFLKQVAIKNVAIIEFSLETIQKERGFPIETGSPAVEIKEKKGQKIRTYSSGKIASIQHFSEGVWDGEQLFFYPDGSLRSKLSYKQGKLHGTTLLYTPEGALDRELTYREGVRTHEKNLFDFRTHLKEL